MAKLATGRGPSTEVKDLASRIGQAQEPEINPLSGWLTAWGEDVPAASDGPAGSMPGMDHSDGSTMPGMMDGSDMDELETASGKDFDTMFLAAGAARAARADGLYPIGVSCIYSSKTLAGTCRSADTDAVRPGPPQEYVHDQYSSREDTPRRGEHVRQ